MFASLHVCAWNIKVWLYHFRRTLMFGFRHPRQLLQLSVEHKRSLKIKFGLKKRKEKHTSEYCVCGQKVNEVERSAQQRALGS